MNKNLQNQIAKIVTQSPNHTYEFDSSLGHITVKIMVPAERHIESEDWINEFAGMWKDQKSAKKTIKFIEKNRTSYKSPPLK